MEDNKREKGFALVLSMVMLLAMTLMGSVLLMNATSQSKVTGTSETTRQTFLSAESGVEERNIMAMTGHKSSEMVRRYIKEANLFKNNAHNKIKI